MATILSSLSKCTVSYEEAFAESIKINKALSETVTIDDGK